MSDVTDIEGIMIAAMKKRAAQPVANLRTLENVLTGSLGDTWIYLVRAAIEDLEKRGYRIMSEGDLEEVRQSGYDNGYNTASELADADRY